MKIKKLNKRLTLNKNTVSNLNPEEMHLVNGGVDCICTCCCRTIQYDPNECFISDRECPTEEATECLPCDPYVTQGKETCLIEFC